ncbi:MAG: phytoene/squalene synthase family protein [Spirochaetaceae bacterium]|nr:MAG: phytoene/squalene synthase family protein [Spirochaetaceae bacterium]
MNATTTHRDVFRSGSTTYFNSSLFFPPAIRDDVSVLYGFVRVADNYVDAVPQDATGFHRFVESYRRARSGVATGDQIIDSFVALSDRAGFDDAWTDAFLSAMERDLSQRVYQTLDETLEYVYGSAEVIGLYMNRILAIPADADEPARLQGRAMQFINFIRDIDEDNGLGRTYLPLSETTLPDLREATARINAAEFTRFVRAQLDRYQEWQRGAEAGYRYLPRRVRIPIQTASDMYNWTARRIAADPFVVYRRKVKPTRMRILARIARNTVTPAGR